jgi:hypothetical protein
MRRATSLCCALLAASLLLAACASSAAETAPDAIGSSAPTDGSAPALPSTPADDAEGEVQVGGDVPASWPAVVPLPDGGTLQTYTLSEDGRFLNAAFVLDGTVEGVAADYDAALVAAGYTVTTSDMAEGISIADYSGEAADINATVADGAGRVNLFVNVTLAEGA